MAMKIKSAVADESPDEALEPEMSGEVNPLAYAVFSAIESADSKAFWLKPDSKAEWGASAQPLRVRPETPDGVVVNFPKNATVSKVERAARPYHDSRKIDVDNEWKAYESWLYAYSILQDDYYNFGGRVSVCWQVDGCWKKSKELYAKRAANSQRIREVKGVKNYTEKDVRMWRPREVTEGFENLGRPPTFAMLFARAYSEHRDNFKHRFEAKNPSEVPAESLTQYGTRIKTEEVGNKNSVAANDRSELYELCQQLKTPRVVYRNKKIRGRKVSCVEKVSVTDNTVQYTYCIGEKTVHGQVKHTDSLALLEHRRFVRSVQAANARRRSSVRTAFEDKCYDYLRKWYFEYADVVIKGGKIDCADISNLREYVLLDERQSDFYEIESESGLEPETFEHHVVQYREHLERESQQDKHLLPAETHVIEHRIFVGNKRARALRPNVRLIALREHRNFVRNLRERRRDRQFQQMKARRTYGLNHKVRGALRKYVKSESPELFKPAVIVERNLHSRFVELRRKAHYKVKAIAALSEGKRGREYAYRYVAFVRGGKNRRPSGFYPHPRFDGMDIEQWLNCSLGRSEDVRDIELLSKLTLRRGLVTRMVDAVLDVVETAKNGVVMLLDPSLEGGEQHDNIVEEAVDPAFDLPTREELAEAVIGMSSITRVQFELADEEAIKRLQDVTSGNYVETENGILVPPTPESTEGKGVLASRVSKWVAKPALRSSKVNSKAKSSG